MHLKEYKKSERFYVANFKFRWNGWIQHKRTHTHHNKHNFILIRLFSFAVDAAYVFGGGGGGGSLFDLESRSEWDGCID